MKTLIDNSTITEGQVVYVKNVISAYRCLGGKDKVSFYDDLVVKKVTKSSITLNNGVIFPYRKTKPLEKALRYGQGTQILFTDKDTYELYQAEIDNKKKDELHNKLSKVASAKVVEDIFDKHEDDLDKLQEYVFAFEKVVNTLNKED